MHEHKYVKARIEVKFPDGHSSSQWVDTCHECFIMDHVEGDIVESIKKMEYRLFEGVN
jgi:hypothetical protein